MDKTVNSLLYALLILWRSSLMLVSTCDGTSNGWLAYCASALGGVSHYIYLAAGLFITSFPVFVCCVQVLSSPRINFLVHIFEWGLCGPFGGSSALRVKTCATIDRNRFFFSLQQVCTYVQGQGNLPNFFFFVRSTYLLRFKKKILTLC